MKALVLLALLGAPGVPEAGRDEGTALDVRVPRMGEAQAQLAYARRLKVSMYGREGKEREFWRSLAVEAYQAVALFHPDALELVAEAHFRAGELLRAGERYEESLREFRACRSLGGATAFPARAGLEIGHVQRRLGNSRAALDAYLEVVSSAGTAAPQRDDAWLWAGRLWHAEGRREDARRAWRAVADGDGDTLDRILAFDYLALSWVEVSDLEAAAGVLNQCVQALSEKALEETRHGEEVRKAMLRMHAIEALQKEIGLKTSGQKDEKNLTR